jgi:hypothetical protein
MDKKFPDGFIHSSLSYYGLHPKKQNKTKPKPKKREKKHKQLE